MDTSLAPQLLEDLPQTVNRGRHHRSRSYDEQTFSCSSTSVLSVSGCRDDSNEVPQDISAFYGHPLTAATHSVDGEALALLHEYQSMQANDSALTRRFHDFHQLDDMDSSHSPDVSTCYQTTVDDDEEEHIVRATVADNTAEYGDFETSEEAGSDVIDCRVSCSRSDSSPLPSTDTFLSGRLATPITTGLAAEAEHDDRSLSRQDILQLAAEADDGPLTLLNESDDDEVDPSQFEQFDDDDDDDDDEDDENRIVYTTAMHDDDDFDPSIEDDVNVDYRMSVSNNWNIEYVGDLNDVQTSKQLCHSNITSVCTGRAVFTTASKISSPIRSTDYPEDDRPLKISDLENRKRKSVEDDPLPFMKLVKREEPDENSDGTSLDTENNGRMHSEQLVSKIHGFHLTENSARRVAAVPATSKTTYVTESMTSAIRNFANKLQSEERSSMHVVQTAVSSQHKVDRCSGQESPGTVNSSLRPQPSTTSARASVILTHEHVTHNDVTNSMPATIHGLMLSNHAPINSNIRSAVADNRYSTCDHHCGSCLIPTLSSATANLVSQTAMMGSTGPLALRNPAALNRPCNGDQLPCCGRGTIRPEIPSSSWSSAPNVSLAIPSMSHIQPQYRQHLGPPPSAAASKQWPTATVVPITSMTSSPGSSQQTQPPRARQRKKPAARMPIAEVVIGQGVSAVSGTNWRPSVEPRAPYQRPIVVGSSMASRLDVRHMSPVCSFDVRAANVAQHINSNGIPSHPLLSSGYQPRQMAAVPDGRVIFDGSTTSVMPTIDAAKHSQKVQHQHNQMQIMQQMQQQLQQQQQQQQSNGDCRTQYRYETPIKDAFTGPPRPSRASPHPFRQTPALDTPLAPDSSTTACNQSADSRRTVNGNGANQNTSNSSSNMPKLPFPLPPVPPGYRLVITHHSLPTNDTLTATTPQVTQLIIDNPAAAEALAAESCSPLGQSKVARPTTDAGVRSQVQLNGDSAIARGELSTESMNTAPSRTPVRPSTLSLNQSTTRTMVDVSPRARTDHQAQLTKIEVNSPHQSVETLETLETRNTANYCRRDVDQCRPNTARNASSAANYLKAILGGDTNGMTMRCDSSKNDDILEKSMKAAKVWDEYTQQLSDSQRHQSVVPQHHYPEHAIKVEQSQSLPSTPTGSAGRLGASPSGLHVQICPNVQLGRRLPLTPDSSTTSFLSQGRATAHAMMMTSPGDRTPDGVSSLQHRRIDDGWIGKQRFIDQNNNSSNFRSNASQSHGNGLNAGYELRVVGSVEMAQLQQQITMTPSSDETTSPEDYLLMADQESKLTDRENWQKSQTTGSTSSKYDAISSFTRRSHISVIPKIDPDVSGYQFYLEASTSSNKRLDEDRLTYLNKGQYYGLVLSYKPPVDVAITQRKYHTVRSVVMVLFRERHSQEEEQKAWEFWHSRQHSFKQRVIDVDSKICGGAAPISIEEIAYNAVAIVWNTQNECVKVNIAVNCLSTDFSHQKGIKGSPLHLQVDTYEDESSSYIMHRTYAQIKVFCDKGADRKTREEERKMIKMSFQGDVHEKHQKPCERTYFYTMADLTTPPILFQPQNLISKVVVTESAAVVPPVTLRTETRSYDTPLSTPRRMQNLNYDKSQQAQRVLLYVREDDDHVFTALMLEYPTVECLLMAIEEKYNVDYKMIKNVFTRSKKCMLVRVDDNFVRHFANESTYIIRISRTASTHDKNDTNATGDVTYDVTLIEIDVQNDGNV